MSVSLPCCQECPWELRGCELLIQAALHSAHAECGLSARLCERGPVLALGCARLCFPALSLLPLFNYSSGVFLRSKTRAKVCLSSQQRQTFPRGILFGWRHWEVLSEETLNPGFKGDGREVGRDGGRDVPRAWKAARGGAGGRQAGLRDELEADPGSR